MRTLLKHTLNPSLAMLFAVGVERLYKVLDPVVLHRDLAVVLTPGFYLPLTMVLLTLLFGSLTSITNDRFMEANKNASATSPIAWFSYLSILCALWMLYVSVDLAFVWYWWLGYAALSLTNAVWNGLAARPHHKPHVIVNVAVALILIIILLVYPSILSTPRWFYVLQLVIVAVKWWQRRRPRFEGVQTGEAFR